MTHTKKTLGQAIDDIIAALEAIEESHRATAVHAACAHLSIAPPPSMTGAAHAQSSSQQLVIAASIPPGSTPKDIRSLRALKHPQSAVEMACIVAYYLKALADADEQKQSIDKTDLEKYFAHAGYKLPKRSDQLLVDTKAAGYLDSAGRGKYKLTPVGHNLVVHTLPRGGDKK